MNLITVKDISLLSILISICTLFYTLYKFRIEWRPWVGLRENNFSSENDRHIMRFALTNSGKLPACNVKINLTIQQLEKIFNEDIGPETIIFPEQNVVLRSDIDKIDMSKDFEVLIKITYQRSSKWWSKLLTVHQTNQTFLFDSARSIFINGNGYVT